jgi:rubrerythrin
MNIEEAISYLKWIRPINPYSLDKKRVQEAIDMAIKALEQEPTGHWISHYDKFSKEGWYECDCCHTERAFNTDYCPDCGAKMADFEIIEL